MCFFTLPPSRAPNATLQSICKHNTSASSELHLKISLSLGFIFLLFVLHILHKTSRSTSYNFFIYKGRFPQRQGAGWAKQRCWGRGGRVLPHRAAHQRAPAPTPRRPSLTRGQVLKVPRSPKRFPAAPSSLQRSIHPPPSHQPVPNSLEPGDHLNPPARRGGDVHESPSHTPSHLELPSETWAKFTGDFGGIAGARLDWGSPPQPAPLNAPLHLSSLDLRKTRPPGGPGAHFLLSLE